MKKATTAALLWLYAGWYTGSVLADMFGVNPIVGLIPGIAVAGLVLVAVLRMRIGRVQAACSPGPFAIQTRTIGPSARNVCRKVQISA